MFHVEHRLQRQYYLNMKENLCVSRETVLFIIAYLFHVEHKDYILKKAS